MKANVNYELLGQFKVDLFSGGKLVRTTDFFPNFITPTGLLYPLNYSFADCFRFLSLGSGNALNSGTLSLSSLGTTGLNIPSAGIICSDGSTMNPQYIGYQGYASGFCGTQLSASGPRFYRAWNIPTGVGTTVADTSVNQGIQIQEFMVSPSSGGDLTGQFAFSRVLKNLFIPNGYSAVVTYQLQILLQNTGITIFPSGTFVTGNADVSNDYEIIREWGSLSGYYRQIYFGLRAVDTNGITYIPSYGDGMEPCTQYVNSMVFYLSPDNTQFDVNTTGGIQTSSASAYAADGLRQLAYNINFANINSYGGTPPSDPSLANVIYYNNNPTISQYPQNDPLSSNGSFYRNLRIGSINNDDINPELSNYAANSLSINYQLQQNDNGLSISYATPGASGWEPNVENFGQQAIFSARTIQLPLNATVNSGQNLITGRRKMITRKSIFAPVSSLGWNTRFGSMVYAFWSNQSNPQAGNNTYYPYIDTMFFDSSGRSTMGHYRYITGIYLTQRGSGILNAYLSLTPGNNIKQYISLQTFQGQYQGSGIYTNPWTLLCDTNFPNTYQSFYYGYDVNSNTPPNPGTNNVICCSGYILNGNTLSNLDNYGFNNITGDNFGNSGSGWGAVYGVLTSDNFCLSQPDLGILDHSLTANTRTHTGALGWPLVLPFGTPVLVQATGVTYYDTGINWQPTTGYTGTVQINNVPAILDTGNFFNGKNQMIKRIDFTPVNSGTWNPRIVNGFYPNVFSEPAIGLDVGYYLTNKAFTGNTVPQSNLGFTLLGATGYYFPSSFSNNLNGDVWVGGSLPPNSGFSILSTTASPNNYFSGFINPHRITGLFLNLSERGYLGNNPLQDGQIYNVFFSGNEVPAIPLYITNIFSADPLNGPFTGYSLLSGNVTLTKWCPPTGFCEHTENMSPTSGYRLLPNFGVANYYGSDTYNPTVGGTLPATSLDNGLEIMLNISYSASSGTAVNCCSIY